jgi:hypothetical protein
MNSRFAPFALLTTFAVACGGGVDFAPAAPPPRALTPKAPEAVEVVDASPAGRNAIEIGTFKATSSAHPPTGDGHEDVLARLRRAAGERGCDAIVLSAIEQKLYATSNGTPLYRAHQSARCLVYP